MFLSRRLGLYLLVAAAAWAQISPSQPATAASAQKSQAPQSNSQPSEVDQRIADNIRAHFKIPANVQIAVGAHHPAAELSGYDTVTVTLSSDGHSSPHDFYISSDGKTLAQINKMDISQNPFSVGDRPTRGDSSAKVTVIVYDDFECPFCARNYSTLFGEVMPQYQSKVRVVYKDFPLADIHPWAIHAAVDANCLFAQSNDAYWDFAGYVHTNQSAIKGENRPLTEQFTALDKSALDAGAKHQLDSGKLNACLKAQDDKDVMASENYGEKTLDIDATPTIFINGKRFDGWVPADDLRAALDSALKDAGIAAPAATPKPAAAKTSSASAPGADSAHSAAPANSVADPHQPR